MRLQTKCHSVTGWELRGGCLREAPCLSLIMSPSSSVVERSGSDNEFFLTFFFLFKFIDLTCNLCRQTRQNLSVGLSELMIPV